MLPPATRRGPQQEKTTQQMFCKAEKYYRSYLYSGKVTLATVHLRRVQVVDSGFAAVLAHVLPVVTPTAPALKILGVGFQWPCRGQALRRRRTTRRVYCGAE
jgi:ABC-type transporter Mla MlaB component